MSGLDPFLRGDECVFVGEKSFWLMKYLPETSEIRSFLPIFAESREYTLQNKHLCIP